MLFVGNYKCKNQNGNAPQPQIMKYKHGFSIIGNKPLLFRPKGHVENKNQNGNAPQPKIRKCKHGFQVFQGSTIVLSPQM